MWLEAVAWVGCRCLASVVLAAVTWPVADASDWITNGVSSPSLRVDARGDAEVGWSSAGVRDYLGCAASPNGWSAMLGVTPHPDGSFSVLLRPGWTGRRYRASVAGPNLGARLAPDAVAYTSGPG